MSDRDHGIASGLAHEAMLQQARQPTPAPHTADSTTISAAALVARIASLEGEVGALRAIRDAARAYVRAMEYADALTRTRFSDDEVRAAWAAASDAYDALVRALEREEAR